MNQGSLAVRRCPWAFCAFLLGSLPLCAADTASAPAIQVKHALTKAAAGNWMAYEGQFNSGQATVEFSDDQLKLGGAVAWKAAVGAVEEADMATRVKLYVPPEPRNWASTAIALYDRDNRRRAYIMVLFSQPGVGANVADIGVFQSEMVRKPLKRGAWYHLAAECVRGTAKVRVWPLDTPEPRNWDIEADLTALVTDVDRVGLRTFGCDGPFRDFEFRSAPSKAREVRLQSKTMRARLAENGTIRGLEILRRGQWEAVGFRHDKFAGPTWVVENDGKTSRIQLQQVSDQVYESVADNVAFRLSYAVEENLVLTASIHNRGSSPFSPERAGVRLGLDCAQTKYPEWRKVYFPTLLRCEATHFWGYFMNPNGDLLGISSPVPVASWHNEYKPLGHLIFTSTIDVLNRPPLPARHPQSLHTIRPGETRSWTLSLQDIAGLSDVKPSLGRTAKAPMIEADRYTLAPGEKTHLTVFSETPSRGEVIAPDGTASPLELRSAGTGTYKTTYTPGRRPGVYTIKILSDNGKTSEAKISVRHRWSWYLQQARKEAIAKPQKGSSHAETWMGLYSGFLAMRHFPCPPEDSQIKTKFDEIFPLMYDQATGKPLSEGQAGRFLDRIQNHALMAGLLAAKHRATGDIHDLERASALADFMLSRQSADGAYRSGRSHYTSVAYCAKSILEVAAEERKLAQTSPVWKERSARHYASAKRAVDELARNLDNIGTEGEPTYEDGMISCSYTQLSLLALQQTDPAERQKYLDAALFLKNGHRCLSQLLVPDSRTSGGSLRYWESQYDILTPPNMMNSPHGWSAWRIYGLWYLYLLTGEEELLGQAQNALGSCVQVIRPDTGELRWGFVPDPYIRASLFEPDPEQPGKGRSASRIIGETYLPMIGAWYKAPPSTWVTGYWGHDGGCCDNDVHEIFKCLEEVALTSAYVVERPNGELAAWNCGVEDKNGTLIVVPAEPVVSRIHVNFRQPHAVEARFGKGPIEKGIHEGMKWIGPGGIPELHR